MTDSRRKRENEQRVIDNGGEWANLSLDKDRWDELRMLMGLMDCSKTDAIRQAIKYMHQDWKDGNIDFVDTSERAPATREIGKVIIEE